MTQESIKNAHKERAHMSEHYGTGLQPWDLEEHMPTWGNVLQDRIRCAVIEYLFRRNSRIGETPLDDVKKAIANLKKLEAILERNRSHVTT